MMASIRRWTYWRFLFTWGLLLEVSYSLSLLLFRSTMRNTEESSRFNVIPPENRTVPHRRLIDGSSTAAYATVRQRTRRLLINFVIKLIKRTRENEKLEKADNKQSEEKSMWCRCERNQSEKSKRRVKASQIKRNQSTGRGAPFRWSPSERQTGQLADQVTTSARSRNARLNGGDKKRMIKINGARLEHTESANTMAHNAASDCKVCGQPQSVGHLAASLGIPPWREA